MIKWIFPALLLACIIACGGGATFNPYGTLKHNTQAYNNAMGKAVQDIPQVVQIEGLGGTIHYLREPIYDENTKTQWVSYAFIHGRYLLTMTIDVEVDHFNEQIKTTADPQFSIARITGFEMEPIDQTYGYIDNNLDLANIVHTSNKHTFSAKQWQTFVDANYDFSKINYDIKEDDEHPKLTDFLNWLKDAQEVVPYAGLIWG